MKHNQSEFNFEHQMLTQTIAIAQNQLDQAIQLNEENKSAILSAKKELREEASHAIGNLWGAEAFEALAELSQFVNPVEAKITDYEALEKKIKLLENLIKSPYFARIDFKYEDEEQPERIYIGRTSLKKNNSYEMIIHDWRSPIASVFYRFVTGPVYYDAPVGRINGEVGLKRQYEINNSVLEYYFDADVQIVDEFLRKLLSQNTSSKMKTIVETIQKEQDIVIRDMENDLMMVQGVAGSGKTSIALHRAAYLMYQGLQAKLSANNIMIISPNSLFEQYISSVLPELGESNVVSVVFDELLTAILEKERIQTRNQFLENLITSSGHREIIKSSIEFKTSETFKNILNRFLEDLPNRYIDFEDIYYENKRIISKEQIKDIVIRRGDMSLDAKLKQLEDYIMELVHEATEERMARSERTNILREIQKFTNLNIESLYYRLIHDKEYIYSLARGLELCEGIEDILEYTQENLDSRNLHYDDAIVLTYLKLKLFGATNEYKNIKQVVIDEAQDYYPLQYEIFHLLFTNSKFTILGDMNQTLEKQEDISIYEQIGKILNKKKSSLITMDKSFRCTNEILQYSLKFIDHSPEIKSFNRKGEEPNIHTASDQTDLNDKIVKEVKACQEQGYRSIGLICKSEKNAKSLYRNLKERIGVQLIDPDSTNDLLGVFIIPVYLSKGLEFDAVLICDADAETYYNQEDKKHLYIACTRALHRLNLFCKGESSPLL
ncbi:MAG: helicase [Firmicutes bacterium]|nr:helicase [Bacillota bacterium]